MLTKDGDWMECKTCNVSYTYESSKGQHIKWETRLKDIDYALNLYPYLNRTILWSCKYLNNYEYKIDEILIPYLIKNVNPKNLSQKIKTILTFS